MRVRARRCLVQMVPQRRRIPLDHLRDAMVDRLQDVIAGREAVAAGGKAAAAARQGQRVAGVDHLVGQPGRQVGEQIAPFDPQDRQVRMEAAPGQARQGVEIDQAMRPGELAGAAELERQLDALGVVQLDRFHHARGLGRVQGQSLALGHGERARVRPAYHDHRDADPIEAGDIGDPGDAHGREVRLHAGQRGRGIDRAVSAAPVGLDTGAGSFCARTVAIGAQIALLQSLTS